MLSQRNHEFCRSPSSVAARDACWRIRVSRRHLMSQRIDRTHPPPLPYFPDGLFAKVAPRMILPDPRSSLFAVDPSSRKASDWNAASVRSFVTYDALMKFADPRATVSQCCPDERRGSSWRQIMEWLQHHSICCMR